MKKIFTLALIAMMAVCAISLTSCNKDEEKNDSPQPTPEQPEPEPEPEPQGEAKTIEFKLKGTCYSEDISKMGSTIADVFQKNVGDLAKVETKNFNITISYYSNKEAELKKAISEIATSEFDTALKQLDQMTYCTFTIIAGGETWLEYEFTLNPKSLDGQWKGTVDGRNYILTLTSTLSTENEKYKFYTGSFQVGSLTDSDTYKIYVGTYMYDPEVNVYAFSSNKKNGSNPLVYVNAVRQGDEMIVEFFPDEQIDPEGTLSFSNRTFTKR